MFVGVGGSDSVAVPRFNAANKMVGYWPMTNNNNAGAVGVTYADPSLDDPDPAVASADYDRFYLSLKTAI